MDQDLNAPVVELNDYLAILKRRKGLILGCAALFALAAAFYSQLQTTTYSAATKVQVEPILLDQIDTATSPARTIDLATEVEIVRSPEVAQLAGSKMNVTTPPGRLRRQVEVSPVEDSQILNIRCTQNRGLLAKACARAFAEAYAEFRTEKARLLIQSDLGELEGILQALDASDVEADEILAEPGDDTPAKAAAENVKTQNNGARISARQEIADRNALLARDYVTPLDTEETQPGATPHNSSLPVNIVIGLVLGSLIGIGLAFLRDRTDDTLKDSGESLERMGIRVLSAIPRPAQGVVRKRGDGAIEDADSAVSEAHRRLRSNMIFLSNRDNTRVVLVTSPRTDTGVTTVAANLGVSLARAGKRVLVISATLRNSTMHELFRLPNTQGLSTVLESPQLAGSVIQPALGMSHLGVLVAGPAVDQPAELLSRPSFPALIRAQLDRYDLVIIEGPPVLTVSDSLAFAPYTDGVILAVDNEFTTRTDVRNAVEQLEAVGGAVLGSVLLNSRGTTSGRSISSNGRGLGGSLLRKPPEPAPTASSAHSAPPPSNGHARAGAGIPIPSGSDPSQPS